MVLICRRESLFKARWPSEKWAPSLARPVDSFDSFSADYWKAAATATTVRQKASLFCLHVVM